MQMMHRVLPLLGEAQRLAVQAADRMAQGQVDALDPTASRGRQASVNRARRRATNPTASSSVRSPTGTAMTNLWTGSKATQTHVSPHSPCSFSHSFSIRYYESLARLAVNRQAQIAKPYGLILAPKPLQSW